MSVIIRLQNLPWSANALDIRQYFHGLSIPEGGVHIVGGELGDAFIAFSTDEDARQAFNRNNGKIKEVKITLMLSSRTEMQRVIEQARSQTYAAFMQPVQTVVPLPAAVPTVIPQMIDMKRDQMKEKTEKRESRRRSRSKSRDRKDRSRERRRHRRSRSRSRERKSSRRRDRSRSRGRSRSRDRKNREYRKKSEEPPTSPYQRDNWNKDAAPAPIQNPKFMGSFPFGLGKPSLSLDNINTSFSMKPTNGMPLSNFSRNSRDSWPPGNSNDSFQSSSSFRDNGIQQDTFQPRFPRNNLFNNRSGPNRFDDIPINACIAMEPFFGGYGEVRRFFQGMFINSNGIKLINDQTGRSTGVVFVRFSSRQLKEEALNLNGELLNGIHVRITHISDKEFDEAIDRYFPSRLDNEDNFNVKNKNISKHFNKTPDGMELKNYTCLIVDDLPTYCKEQDILHLFSQHPLVALILTTKKKGGFIAYVKFSSTDVAQKAMEEKSLHVVGGKQVTVRPCTDATFDEINNQHEVNLTDKNTESIGTDCISLSQLPEKTTEKDIADFFSDIGVIPMKVHLMNDNTGFTGKAFCEFSSNEEASKAMRKNDTFLGNSAVSVGFIKRVEMQRVVEQTSPTTEPIIAEEKSQEKLSPKLTVPASLSPKFNLSDDNRPSNPSRFFESRLSRFSMHTMNPKLRIPPTKDVFDDVPPGCTVYMKNVPYKATTNDILNFFEGFDHTSNVSRRYNANNMPTDEAKIIFCDAEAAANAVRDLQEEKIWDRHIFLRQE